MRPQLVGIGPLLPQIQADLGVSFGVVGLLTTIPVLLMGLFAPIGPWVSGRIGPRNAIALCMLGIVVRPAPAGPAGRCRDPADDCRDRRRHGHCRAVLLIVVKLRQAGSRRRVRGRDRRRFAHRRCGRDPAGRRARWVASALVAFALAGLVSLGCWLAFIRPDPPEDRATGRPNAWRSSTAWMLVAVFATQSLLYYSAISWLPAVYVERGWSEADAGNLVAVLHAVGSRQGSRFRSSPTGWYAAHAAGVGRGRDDGRVSRDRPAARPRRALGGRDGVGLGAVFPLVLTLPVDVAEGRPRSARPQRSCCSAAVHRASGRSDSGSCAT